MIIYYNPECTKCNDALDLLKNNNCAVTIREYLKDPPSEEELRELVKLLGCEPFDLVRQTEPEFIEKFSNLQLSGEQWISILSKNPLLIQRPIVIDGKKAIVGRPPSLVLNLL